MDKVIFNEDTPTLVGVAQMIADTLDDDVEVFIQGALSSEGEIVVSVTLPHRAEGEAAERHKESLEQLLTAMAMPVIKVLREGLCGEELTKEQFLHRILD